MKYQRLWTALTLVLTVIIFPSFSFSEIKIELKNGRSIIADSCRDTKGKLICNKMDGSFEIDKKEIENMKEITLKHPDISQSWVEETKDEAEKTAPATAEPSQKTENKDEGAETDKKIFSRGKDPEAEERLDQINQRKTELKAEREKLSNEREQLLKDVNDTGLIKSKAKLDEIKKSLAELADKITKFNEEVNRLNEEEKKIIDLLNK